MRTATVQLLLVSGSLRVASSSTAVLRTVLELLPSGVSAELYGGLATLPHFNPDDDPHDSSKPLHPAVLDLRQRIGKVDALLFSTPEYAGALPGSFKNLLDWTVGSSEMYRKPVAWINTTTLAAPTGGADAHASLRKVLGYLNADIAEIACVRVPVQRGAVGNDGQVDDPALRDALSSALTNLAAYVQSR